MEYDDLLKILDFDYKMNNDNIPKLMPKTSNSSFEDNTLLENLQSDYKITKAPKMTPITPQTYTNNLLSNNKSMDDSIVSIIAEIEGNISKTEISIKRAKEFKSRLQNIVKKVDTTVEFTEKELVKILNIQLDKAKRMLKEGKGKLSEREELVSSVNELYERMRKIVH